MIILTLRIMADGPVVQDPAQKKSLNGKSVLKKIDETYVLQPKKQTTITRRYWRMHRLSQSERPGQDQDDARMIDRMTSRMMTLSGRKSNIY